MMAQDRGVSRRPHWSGAMLVSGMLLITGCAGLDVRDCSLPLMSEADVARIGQEYMDSKGVLPSFRANAEARVTPVGCEYHYEEAKSFDSSGITAVVVIGRDGAVREFYALIR